MAGTTIVDRLNKLSGKDATTIAKALENLEEGGGIGGFEIHICASGEYDAETKVPTIEEPDSSTLYLVPTSSKSKNMFDEYVWTGTDWEKFGTGSVALPSPTTSDNGKVLGVDGGEYALVEQAKLPNASASDKGKMVGVNYQGNYYLGKVVQANLTDDINSSLIINKGWGELRIAQILYLQVGNLVIIKFHQAIHIHGTDGALSFNLSDAMKPSNTPQTRAIFHYQKRDDASDNGVFETILQRTGQDSYSLAQFPSNFVEGTTYYITGTVIYLAGK